MLCGLGVAGLTLGGGWGYIAKSRGLSIDSIISVEMVLPDGKSFKEKKYLLYRIYQYRLYNIIL